HARPGRKERTSGRARDSSARRLRFSSHPGGFPPRGSSTRAAASARNVSGPNSAPRALRRLLCSLSRKYARSRRGDERIQLRDRVGLRVEDGQPLGGGGAEEAGVGGNEHDGVSGGHDLGGKVDRGGESERIGRIHEV